MRNSLLILMTALLVTPAFGQTFTPLAPQAETEPDQGFEIRSDNCLVAYKRTVEIPAEALGKIKSITADEGMTVKAGDEIAQIDDTQTKLQVDLAKTKEEEAIMNATNDINYKDAVDAEKIAKEEAQGYKELYKQGATPYWEMQKKVLEAARALLRISLAEMQMKIAKVQYFGARAELRIAEDEINRRKVVAPFGGFIESREVEEGQWVQPGSPVVRLVQMDELKVQGDIDALRYADHVRIGAPVTVRVFYRGEDADPHVIQSKISFVSSEIKLDDTVKIGVVIKNTPFGGGWLIKPGMKAQIVIDTGDNNPGRAPKSLF